MRLLAVCLCCLTLGVLSLGAGASPPRLLGSHDCPGQAGFTCSTLRVPLDWSGHVNGTLDLAVASGPSGPRGVLLVLTGGPGQPGVPYISRTAAHTGLGAKYRVVMVDQRGTGGGALDCPELQREMGFSDLQPPTAAAVRACAAKIGPNRQFFGTDDVVRDLDALRRALGAGRWVLDGTSYGTYTAERYALAYPGHVSKLVLDSVVPHAASGQLETQAFPRVTQVLRNVCGSCAADLAAVVARYSVFDPTYRAAFDVPSVLNQARRGNPGPMNGMLAAIRTAEASTAASALSQGLHASALCEDWLWPWGSSSAPIAGRQAALDRYAARLPKSELGPFSRATVTGNGIMQQCLYWPPTPATPQPPPGARIQAPALILAGDRDLSTPLPWPRAELRLLPHGKLVTIHGWGHSTQRNPQAAAAVQAFLLGS